MGRRRFGSIVAVGKDKRAWIEARYTPPTALRDKWPRMPRRFAKRFPEGWEIQAEQWLNDEERLIRLGTWTPPSQRRHQHQGETTTFHDYATKWIERRRKPDGKPARETTKQKYRENLRNHLDPAFGSKPISEISYHDITEWYDQYPIGADGKGEAQRVQCYVLLKAIMKTAATEPLDDAGTTLIDKSPATFNIAKSRKRHVTLIAEMGELIAISSAMPDWLALAVVLAGTLGLREGECCGLRRSDFELDATPPMLHVRHAVKPIYDAHGHRSLILDEPKTPGSMRDIVIPDSLIPLIIDQFDRYSGEGDDGMLFPGRKGNALFSPQSLRNAWERARGIVPRLRTMRFHDLRDTALTRLAELGATGGELMAQAGHTSLKVASVYQKTSDSHRGEVMARLDRAIVGAEERPAKASGASASLVDELARLGEMHGSGVLDDEEFKSAKKKLLGES
jgi:integrase